MTLFDHYHELAAQLLGRDDFPLPLPNMERNYPHNIGLLSDAEESALAATVLQLTRGLSYESWQTFDMEQRVPWMQQAIKKAGEDDSSNAVTRAAVIADLTNQVQAGMNVVTADDVAGWPNGLLDQLLTDGILSPADNVKSIACDACGDDHVETVQFVEAPPSSKLRAYIACPETGRVRVPLDRLRRWSINLDAVQVATDGEPNSSGCELPDNVTITSTSSAEFLPTPSADDAKGLRDAADYCRAQAARLGDARATWWWTQARVYDTDAERADGAKTESSESSIVHEPLSERAQNVLVAMLEMGAVDSDDRRTTEEIAIKALGDGTDPNALKGVMAELKTREFVLSKTGRGGGCWLTDKGRARAEKLRNQ